MKKTKATSPLEFACSHRAEFCALCADRPLKSPAEERLIRAALRYTGYAAARGITSKNFWCAARAVARERKKPGAMSAKKE